MRKDDAKPTTKAKEAAATAASAAADGGTSALVPATEAAATDQAAAPQPVSDEQLAGHGGLYNRVNGTTKLLHRTTQPSTEKDAQ